MPSRERAKLLLRGFAKLAAVIVVAGGAGVVIGVALAELTGDDDLATSGVTGTQTPLGGATTSTTRTATTTSTAGTTTDGQGSLGRLRVQVLGAVLHPAATPSGQRRQRARLIVRVRAQNRGRQPVTVARPALLVDEARVEADPSADTPRTQIGELAAGETKGITLRFELAGAVTAKVTAERRARMVVAGRARPMRVKIGAPLRARERPPAPTTTQTTSVP